MQMIASSSSSDDNFRKLTNFSEPSSRQNVPPNLRSMFKKVEFKHPLSRNWLIHLHYVRKELDICKSIINEELIRLNGQSEYANYILALIYRSEGKMQESLERLQICHELEPNNVDLVRQMARSLFLLGRHKLAIGAYEKSVEMKEESDWETHYNMGLCYLYLKEYEKAKEHMNYSLQSRVSYEAFTVLAQISLSLHNPNEAISVYERGIKIFPDNSDLMSKLGVLYMRTRKDEAAFLKLSTALAMDPINPQSVVAIASMMQNYGDFDSALGKYKIAMQNIPDSASLWNNIGMCYFGKKKYVAAISCLKRANYLSSFDWKILHNLGLVHLHMQQYASAFHFLTAAINLKPDQSHTFMLLAIAIFHLEEVEQGIEAFEQSIKLNKLHETTKPFVLHLNFTICLYNAGEYEKAHQELMEAFKIFEENVKNVEFDEGEIFKRIKKALQNLDFKLPPTLKNGNKNEGSSFVDEENAESMSLRIKNQIETMQSEIL